MMVELNRRRRRGAHDAARGQRPRVHRHHRASASSATRARWPRPAASRSIDGRARGAAHPGRARARLEPIGRAEDQRAALRRGRVGAPTRIDPALAALLFDPQTSGGLLAAVDPSVADQAAAALAAAGVVAARVGTRRPTGACGGATSGFSLPFASASWYKLMFLCRLRSSAPPCRRAGPSRAHGWEVIAGAPESRRLLGHPHRPAAGVRARPRVLRPDQPGDARARGRHPVRAGDWPRRRPTARARRPRQFEQRTKAAQAEVYREMDENRRQANEKRAAIMAETRRDVDAQLADASARLKAQAAEARTELEKEADALGEAIVGTRARSESVVTR